jgi:hypothetical protein
MGRTAREKQDLNFSIFWEFYPKKRAKLDAQKAWRKINPSEDGFYSILSGVGRYMRSGEWKDPQFIPYPATFLNGRRWEDDLTSKNNVLQPGSESEPCLFKKGYVPRQVRV